MKSMICKIVFNELINMIDYQRIIIVTGFYGLIGAVSGGLGFGRENVVVSLQRFLRGGW